MGPCTMCEAVLVREESENREDGGFAMEEDRGMRRSKQDVRGGEPNTAAVHRAVSDGPLEGLSGATNHAHGDPIPF